MNRMLFNYYMGEIIKRARLTQIPQSPYQINRNINQKNIIRQQENTHTLRRIRINNVRTTNK